MKKRCVVHVSILKHVAHMPQQSYEKYFMPAINLFQYT